MEVEQIGLLRVTQPTITLEERVTQLFEQLRSPVYRYLCTTFGGTTAEDITQEAFLRLHRELSNGRPIDNTRAWVFRVAHNLAVNQIRHDHFTEALDADSWERLLHLREDTTPGPEQRLIEGEQARRFQAGLLQLSARQRQCLVLRVEGLRYREIAEILDIEVSSVAESLRRGVKKLMRAVHD